MADNAAIWAWDLYPLAPDAWPNRRMATDAPPGAVVDMANPGGVHESTSRTMGSDHFAPRMTRVVVVGDSRKGYRPTAADLDILRRAFRDADAENPSWPNVEAELVVGGHDKTELAKLNAPTLLRLLGKVRSDDDALTEAAAVDALPGRVIRARDQYLQACEALNNDSPTCSEAYELLKRIYAKKDKPSPLPAFDTWARYVRDWRSATGQQKNSRRDVRIGDVRRHDSGSITTIDRIADARSDED